MATDPDDPVKKIFGKTAKELLAWRPEDHSKFHDANAFCGNAGPEELQHLQELLTQLTDKEIKELTGRVGISFGGVEVTRAEYESVLDEANREDFYREYRKILESRK